MTCNNPNVDLVNMNAYIQFCEILSICSQDIEGKQKYDRRNDGQPKSSIAPLFQSGAITICLVFGLNHHLADNSYKISIHALFLSEIMSLNVLCTEVLAGIFKS